MFIEILEPRIAPAALTAKLSAGVLKIFGDPVTADIDITQTGTSIEVFDGATSLGVFQNVKSLDVRPEGGGVTVDVSLPQGIDGSCKIAAKGTVTVNLVAESIFNGGLTFTGDLSTQVFNIGGFVVFGKGVTYKPGSGSDAITIGNGANINGNLTLAGVEIGAFTVDTAASNIAGSLIITNTGNALPVTFTTNGSLGVAIGGGVTYNGGNGNDSLGLTAAVTKSVVFKDTSGDNSLGLGNGSLVRGSVTLTGGIGNDSLNIQGGRVDGNVTLKLAGGNNTFNYGIAGMVTIAGNLLMTAGDGNDTVQSFGGGMTLGKNLTLQLGNGTNQVIASILVAGTKLSVTTGIGVDTVSIDGTAANVAAIVSLGAGADSLGGSLFRSVKSGDFNGGAGLDHFFENTLVADPLTIRSFEDLS